MKRILILIILLFSYSFIFIGCQKKKEEKILGTWQYIYLSDVGNTVQTWYFTDNNKFINTIKADTIISCDTADWSLSAKFLSPVTLKISNFNNWANGTYKVLTLSKKYLIIQRITLENGHSDGAFNRIEFVKLH